MPKPNRIEFTLPPATQERIKKVMERTNLQRSTVIRMLIEQSLWRWETENSERWIEKAEGRLAADKAQVGTYED